MSFWGSNPVGEQRWKAHELVDRYRSRAEQATEPEEARKWLEAANTALETEECCQRIENDKRKSVLGRW